MSSSSRRAAGCAAAITGLAIFTAACSAGNNGAGALIPSAATPLKQQPMSRLTTGRSSVSFLVHVPVVTGTRSIAIALSSVNGEKRKTAPTVAAIAASARGCTSVRSGFVCTLDVNAPVGADLFSVAAYASKSGGGRVIASAAVSADVVAGADPRVTLDLDGVPASVSFSPARLPLVVNGGVERIPVVVNALDASGATILGSAPYRSPVGLQIQNDPARALTLSTSSIARPGTTLTVTYDSSKPLGNATIVASDNGMHGATLLAAPLAATPAQVTMFDDGTPAAITLSESGFSGKFHVSLGHPGDARVSVIPGTLGSGTAVVTVSPKVHFDVTTIAANDGNVTASIPLSILPHNGSYAAFGAQHILTSPVAMIAGPDGKFWISDPGTGNLVSFDPASRIYTPYSVDPSLQGPLGLAFDANGNLWFADGSQIGEFTPQTGAVATYSTGLESSANVTQIVAGPNGQMWFYDQATTSNRVSGSPTYFGSIATASGAIVEHKVTTGAGPISGSMSMVLAPDGMLWFADQYNAKIGRFDTASGRVTEYATGTPAYPDQSPMRVLTTSDGKIWFVADDFTGASSVVGWLDPAHPKAITYETGATTAGLFGAFIVGVDGNLWFTQNAGTPSFASDQVTLGVVNPATGAVYDYPAAVPQFVAGTALIAQGSTLWFLDSAFGQVGKVAFK